MCSERLCGDKLWDDECVVTGCHLSWVDDNGHMHIPGRRKLPELRHSVVLHRVPVQHTVGSGGEGREGRGGGWGEEIRVGRRGEERRDKSEDKERRREWEEESVEW